MQLFFGEPDVLPHEFLGLEELADWPQSGAFSFSKEERELATIPSPGHKAEVRPALAVRERSGPVVARRGRWDESQNRLYFQFLKEHRTHFQLSQLRRIDKIFKGMSKYIGSRSAEQCRSHHQKMEKKYLRFQVILDSLALHFEDRLPCPPLFQ